MGSVSHFFEHFVFIDWLDDYTVGWDGEGFACNTEIVYCLKEFLVVVESGENQVGVLFLSDLVNGFESKVGDG